MVKKIIEEKQPHRFTDYFENLDKHFSFTSIPFGEYFITTGDDITEFVHKQETLESENQHLDELIKERTAELETSAEEIRLLKLIEREKEKTYLATMHGAQHIMFNLLNQLQLVDREISTHSDFDKRIHFLFGEMMEEATTLMHSLSSVEKADDNLIRESVAPK